MSIMVIKQIKNSNRKKSQNINKSTQPIFLIIIISKIKNQVFKNITLKKYLLEKMEVMIKFKFWDNKMTFFFQSSFSTRTKLISQIIKLKLILSLTMGKLLITKNPTKHTILSKKIKIKLRIRKNHSKKN